MFSTATIRSNLGDAVTQSTLHAQGGIASRQFSSVMFWTKGNEPDDDTAYVLASGDLHTLPSGNSKSLFLCACSDESIDLTDYQGRLAVIAVNLSLAELGNRLLLLLTERRNLAEYYRQALRAENPLRVLLQRGSEHLKATILLLSSSYSYLEGKFLESPPAEPLLLQLQTDGALNLQNMEELNSHQRPLKENSLTSKYTLPVTGQHCLIRRITSRETVVGYLFLLIPEPERMNFYLDELEELADYVQQGVSRNQVRSCVLDGPFNDIVQDILAGRLTGRDHVAERASAIPSVRKGERFTLVLISFEEPAANLPWDFFAGQLWHLFPFSNIVLYERQLMVFAKPSESDKKICDEEKLQAFLEEHRAYAGVGTNTKYLSALPTMFQQCKAAQRFGIAMRGKHAVTKSDFKPAQHGAKERIFRYEDYSIYLFIEMLASDYFSDFHHGRLYYLCHQDFLSVERYDRKNGTDYREVLYAYLANNCKVTQTSRVLYMHRNTLLAKLKKIEEIIGKSLEDNFLRERLLFSYHVKEYVELCLHSDIFPQAIID
jgi:hypothetical protein